MKKRTLILTLTAVFILVAASCKNRPADDGSEGKTKPGTGGQILIGKEMVTEIFVKPDTTGDPWEVEKVKGFDGNQMYKILFENIYSDKLKVFDCFTGEPLSVKQVKDMEKEYNLDISNIGKIQYIEDWYFDPSTSSIIKKIKSFSFGYQYLRGAGLPVGYKPIFLVKQ